ncbi:unnamed protein product [Cladocopium goreaui]|uniref:USP domain-containing protein n=1 Tax=Cladocopium goreaui TaxID=2562237 RepID=A0A9P1BGZ3_9DINO|nr:unnamed protein product [Cladocopium goreaui]
MSPAVEVQPDEGPSDFCKQKVMNDTESLLGDLDALFFNSWARPGDDLQPEIMLICQKWKQKQLQQASSENSAETVGMMDAWIEKVLEELQRVLCEEASTVHGRVSGETNIWMLQPKILESWQRLCGDSTPVLKATVTTTEAPKRSAEIEKEPMSPAVEVKPDEGPSDFCKQKVMNDTESLLGDLDALFFNSWARPGDDLQPEIMLICQKWKQKQLQQASSENSAETVGMMDAWIEKVLEELQRVLCEEASTVHGRVSGETNIWMLQPKILESWQRLCGDSTPVLKATVTTTEAPKRSAEIEKEPMSPAVEVKPDEGPSDFCKQKVMNDTESLLGDLDALFFNSWARPGDDLQPEIMLICQKWKQKQLQQASSENSAETVSMMDAWIEKVLEELQRVLCEEASTVHGRVSGETNIWMLQPKILESWQRLCGDSTPVLKATVTTTEAPKRSAEIEIKPMSPAVEVKPDQGPSDFCKQKVFRGIPRLLGDLEGLFADSWARPGVDLQPEMTELCQTWKSKQLQQLTQVEASETLPWIQTLLDQVEKVLHQEAVTADGRLLGTDFTRCQQQIVESWEKDNPTALLRDVKTSNRAKSSQAANSGAKATKMSDAKQRSSAVHETQRPQRSQRPGEFLRVKKRQALPQAGSILMKESRDQAHP